MQSNERRLIQDLFARLRDAEHQRRDPEVERLLASELQQTPHAVYTLAQTVIAQNQALEAAAQRIEELENGGTAHEDEEEERYARLPGAMGAPHLGRRGGSVPKFGRGAVPQGGGFLANAGQVAMGVAGGMLLGEAAKSLLGSGSEAQAATGAADSSPAAAEGTDGGALAENAGANDAVGDSGEGGGGLFGWLFGNDGSGGGADDTSDGGWDDGGSDY